MKYRLLICMLFLYTCAHAQETYLHSLQTAFNYNDANTQVQLLKLTIKDKNRVVLNWNYASINLQTYFTIEKSIDGIAYETLAIQKKIPATDNYSFTDEQPFSGYNYYRIKYIQRGANSYSEIQKVMIGTPITCKFYPNPVENMLIVRTSSAVDIMIANESGKVQLIKSLPSGLNVLNVQNLETGAYIVTITQKNNAAVFIDRLIKK